MTTLSVIIPAFNKEGGIADISLRVLTTRPALAQVGLQEMELLVVDDGSADRTAEIASQIAGVTLNRHPQNKGYGAALRTGFSHDRGELIGFLDADGTYPPEYFPQLCQQALNCSDLVIGSRTAGADSQMPRTHRLGELFFATLLSLLARRRVTDSASGMRVFPRSILERIYPLWVKPNPGDEHPRPARGHSHQRSAHSLQRARGALQAERRQGWRALSALYGLDRPHLQSGADFGHVGLVGVGLASFFLSTNGWNMTRLWFYLLASAMVTYLKMLLSDTSTFKTALNVGLQHLSWAGSDTGLPVSS